MGKSSYKSVGGGSNTSTANAWNDQLGSYMTGGGFNNLMNNQGPQASLGYQQFFNPTSNPMLNQIPQVTGNYSAPGYGNQAAQGQGGSYGGMNSINAPAVNNNYMGAQNVGQLTNTTNMNQGFGAANQLMQMGNQQAPNLDVNSQYAQAMRGMLERNQQRNNLDLMNRMSASGGGLFGSGMGQMQGLLDAEQIPAIAQATAQANLQQGQLQQNQQALNAQNMQAGMQGYNQLFGMQGQEGQANIQNMLNNSQMQNQFNMNLNQLHGSDSQFNAANNMQAQGLNNQFGLQNQQMGNEFSLNNAQMQNQFMQYMNGLRSNDSQFGANLGMQAQNANAQNQLNAAQIGNNYNVGMAGVGTNLRNQDMQSSQNLLNQLFQAYQQSNQIGSPQAQMVEQKSMGSQIMGGVMGLGNLALSAVNTFGNPFGGGGGQSSMGQFGSGWQNPIGGYNPGNPFSGGGLQGNGNGFGGFGGMFPSQTPNFGTGFMMPQYSAPMFR